ncbi:MAG TPA: SUMF1/EgtB/PvdO family nonheme iron enzyme [Phnomibacter sp.]|nr:SUMF1/EgtB/PvdO family nonheme iron enzyme [Phnomibacter sp.]
MLYRLPLLALLAFGFASQASPSRKPHKAVSALPLQQSFVLFAPGQYMQTLEVTNGQYQQFLNDLLQQGRQQEYHRYYPDTLGFASHGSAAPYQQFYFQHASFAQYPVVNITRAGAEAFAQWYTQQYQSQPQQPLGPQVQFMLPTRQQWVLAARSGKLQDESPYPWPGQQLRNKKGQKLCNYAAEVASGASPRADITAPAKSFWPNALGLYNMCGNVAEMVADAPLAMGGNYTSPAAGVGITQSQPLGQGSSPTVGFRLVAIVAGAGQ